MQMATRPSASTIMSLIALILLAIAQFAVYPRMGWSSGVILGAVLMLAIFIQSVRRRP